MCVVGTAGTCKLLDPLEEPAADPTAVDNEMMDIELAR